jgi:transcriptional regulator with XRE-family HTH domain
MINTLRSLRTKLGYSQNEAALMLGISVKTLQGWEKNAERIPYEKIKLIERVYKTPQNYIFFGKESAFSEILKKYKAV